jgi:subtilase family serine protease
MSRFRFRRSQVLVLPSAVVIALGVLAAAGTAQAASSATRPLAGTTPAWASKAKIVSAARSSAPVSTQVYLAGNKAGLAAYARAVSTPGNALYRHFLTPAQADARFGASPAAVAAVDRWLRASGLRVSRVSEQEILATGTVAQAEHAYGTRLNEYKTSGGTFRAPATNVQVPSGVAADLLSVGGLENRPDVMKPASLANAAGPVSGTRSNASLPASKGADGATYLGNLPCSAYWGQQTDTTDPPINGAQQPYNTCGYTPAQLRGAYNLGSRQTGAGVTIAITDAYGSPTIVSDASTYAVNQGDRPFAPGQFTQTLTPADWTDQNECGDWSDEETLDIESVHALAPGARVHYYGANSCNDSDFITTLTSIIDTHSADIITNSWGEPISDSNGNETPATLAEYNQLFEQAAVEGIEVAFSSADCGPESPVTVCGSGDGTTQPQADFPSSDPWVTSVGGTAEEIGKHNNLERAVPWGDDGFVDLSGTWTSLSAYGYEPHGWIFGAGGGTSGPGNNGSTFAGYPQPWYQRGIVPKGLSETLPTGAHSATPMRTTPDVSMDADPYTGFLFGLTQALPDGTTGYAESEIGGTSLASPLFAALVADSMQSRVLLPGFVNPALYADGAFLPGLFRQVITPTAATAPYATFGASDGDAPFAEQLGDDLALVGTRGYNEAGGLGTPSGVVPGL